MKKILLGGTALAAAAAMAAPAMAADANVTSGLSIKLSGFVAFEAAAIIDTDTRGMDRDYDFNSNARFQWDIKNVTDSGLEYGGRIRMNNMNRKQNITVDRTYVYVKGGFGTVAFGDQPATGPDFGYFFAPDTILNAPGGYGDNLDGNYRYGGADFFSLDPTYHSGLGNQTSIKYASPNIGGFIFGVTFTPVISASSALSNGTTGSGDLSNEGQLYENVISGGLGYENEFDGTSVKVRGTATYGNGIDHNFDLETYTAGAEVAFGGIDASVVWVGTPSGFANGETNRDFNTFAVGLGYTWGDFAFGLGYGYTWADSGNDLTGSGGDRFRDVKDNHLAGVTVAYQLAPGLRTYGEVIYEIQNFRQTLVTHDDGSSDYERKNSSWSQTVLQTGISVAF
jgi:hypothetical protein